MTGGPAETLRQAMSPATRAGRALASRDAADAAVVRSPIAPLVGEPRVSASQESQLLAGHAVAVLARDGDWCRVRGPDDYEGWMHGGYLADAERVLGTAGASWYRDAALSLGCTVTGPLGARRLPLGAVLLPDERRQEGDLVAGAEVAARFAPSGAGIVETARRRFAGTGYQWGGVTPWGADCSGLVQSVYALHGLPLPRDAWQQALAGVAVDATPFADAAALAAGDLLVFSDRDDGRITHIGLATGAGGMVHLGLGRGGYREERLLDADDPYVRRLATNFRGARRLR